MHISTPIKTLSVLSITLAAFSALPVSAATLFAPGVTKESGWYDTNKAFTNEDSNLCWAATASNVIAWYLDTYERGGGAEDLKDVQRDTSQIFQNFKSNWYNSSDGYGSMDGVNWYFTGGFSSGANPPQLEVPNSGGYLKHLDGVGDRAWGLIDIHNYQNWGNQKTGKLFFDRRAGDEYPDETHETFSNIVLEQLALGVAMLCVYNVYGNSSSGHAITLWGGCEYDEETRLVTKIYVTDSDDANKSNGLKEYSIVDAPSGNGIMMDNYWCGSNQFGRITASTMMYAAYIPEPSAFGFLAGLGVLTLAVSRRRRR